MCIVEDAIAKIFKFVSLLRSIKFEFTVRIGISMPSYRNVFVEKRMFMPIACCKSRTTIMSYRDELSVSSAATNHLFCLIGAISMKETVSSMSTNSLNCNSVWFSIVLSKYFLGRRFAFTSFLALPVSLVRHYF